MARSNNTIKAMGELLSNKYACACASASESKHDWDQCEIRLSKSNVFVVEFVKTPRLRMMNSNASRGWDASLSYARVWQLFKRNHWISLQIIAAASCARLRFMRRLVAEVRPQHCIIVQSQNSVRSFFLLISCHSQ